jgi:hypothetical protein
VTSVLVRSSSTFFQGTELPRLLVLVVIAILGWGGVWWYAHRSLPPDEPPLQAAGKPPPIETDHAIEFQGVKDRTPMGMLDNPAYALLLERARSQTPAQLAAISRRDILLPHLWNDPARYRGVPVHVLGSALRILRYPSKLSKNGWLYEAWVITPETSRAPYVCVFEDAPEGLPIGGNVSERVVFNGYFLKIMRYQAGDAVRGAPVLVGRIGWTPADSAHPTGDLTLKLSLIVVALFFLISLVRWGYQLRRLFVTPSRQPPPPAPPSDTIDPAALEAWIQSQSEEPSTD